jgi:hypothetical protein
MNTSAQMRWVWRRCLGSPTEGPSPNAAECQDLVVNDWHEESRRRYEELAHQSLELAEQRQRCA